jgi:hypothetical protein
MYVKNCLDCGVEFLAKRSNTKFCSKACGKRALRAADPEKLRERDRAYHQAHREKLAERRRVRYTTDPQKFREQARARYAVDPEKFQEQARVRRYSKGGFSTAMMSISNAMKKLKEEQSNDQP